MDSIRITGHRIKNTKV